MLHQRRLRSDKNIGRRRNRKVIYRVTEDIELLNNGIYYPTLDYLAQTNITDKHKDWIVKQNKSAELLEYTKRQREAYYTIWGYPLNYSLVVQLADHEQITLDQVNKLPKKEQHIATPDMGIIAHWFSVDRTFNKKWWHYYSKGQSLRDSFVESGGKIINKQ